MKPVRSIRLPEEMCCSEIRKIFRILGKDSVRFVGGCVRNAILGEVIGDIDLATTHLPQYVTDRFSKNGIKTIPTGIRHGTVTVVIKSKSYEITTLRIDKNTDGRHAEVQFSDDWLEDAKRRDFTMNALYADLEGNIYDPLGQGLRDLEKRKVRFVGDPAKRIEEDYLRILRFFRFFTQYGRGKINSKGFAACVALKNGIGTLSRERVTQELFKILSSSDAVRGLGPMADGDILPFLFRQPFDPKSFRRLIDRGSDEFDNAMIARLVLLGGVSRKSFDILCNSLVLNRKQAGLLKKICETRIKTIRIDLQKLREWMVYDGPELSRIRLDLAFAYGRLSASEHRDLLRDGIDAGVPDFPVKGGDLSENGYRGPALGEELDRLKRIWIKSGFTLGRGELLGAVRCSVVSG